MSNNTYFISRIVRTGTGFKERRHIKSFKTSQAMYAFLNKQPNNDWKICNEGGLKAGVYVFAGGQWHNVKSIDSSALAHM